MWIFRVRQCDENNFTTSDIPCNVFYIFFPGQECPTFGTSFARMRAICLLGNGCHGDGLVREIIELLIRYYDICIHIEGWTMTMKEK